LKAPSLVDLKLAVYVTLHARDQRGVGLICRSRRHRRDAGHSPLVHPINNRVGSRTSL